MCVAAGKEGKAVVRSLDTECVDVLCSADRVRATARAAASCTYAEKLAAEVVLSGG